MTLANRILAFFVACSASLCFARSSITELADEQVFSLFGSTIFAQPLTVSMKEVHLDAGALKGKEVVIEGQLVEMGEHGSFAIFADESARLLVALSGAVDEVERLERAKLGRVRMLGRLESGKKGLPYLVLHGLNVDDADSGA